MSEYNLTEHTRFAIQCESCSKSTGFFDTWEDVDKQAKLDGYTFEDTLEDGTINLCRECRKESDPEQSIKAGLSHDSRYNLKQFFPQGRGVK